eukprot:5222745-Pleurochrysis_carterae.AAC.1
MPEGSRCCFDIAGPKQATPLHGRGCRARDTIVRAKEDAAHCSARMLCEGHDRESERGCSALLGADAVRRT